MNGNGDQQSCMGTQSLVSDNAASNLRKWIQYSSAGCLASNRLILKDRRIGFLFQWGVQSTYWDHQARSFL